MSPAHAATVQRTTDHFAAQPGVIGLLLVGSLAHGFETEDSEVDVMIVVSDAEYLERVARRTSCFLSSEPTPDPEGRVNGKYTSLEFMDEVEERGTEPARFAFQDAQVLFSRDSSLLNRVQAIPRYPLEDKANRIARFQTQFEAWQWYAARAFAKNDLTLLRTAVSKLVLFGGRIVLAHNEVLYPSHQWFLRVLGGVRRQPPDLLAEIQALALDPTPEAIEEFAKRIRKFRPWDPTPATWPAQFMADSENNWLTQPAPVEDI